jgi:hypothetical protein
LDAATTSSSGMSISTLPLLYLRSSSATSSVFRISELALKHSSRNTMRELGRNLRGNQTKHA